VGGPTQKKKKKKKNRISWQGRPQAASLCSLSTEPANPAVASFIINLPGMQVLRASCWSPLRLQPSPGTNELPDQFWLMSGPYPDI